MAYERNPDVNMVEFGGGKDWEFGISRCKLLYIGQIYTRSYCIAQGTIFNIL